MEKGYIFSVEALAAVFIFIIFFGVVVNFFLGTTEHVFSRITIQRIAIDALDVLDETDALESLDAQIITDAVERVMPERLSWKMTITHYSHGQGVFSKTGAFSIGETAADFYEKDSAKNKRVFLTFAKGKIDRYNTAELWVWLK